MPENRLNDEGVKMLVGFEAMILHPYRDVANIETVCVGHVIKPEDRVWLKDGVTRGECEAVLKRDIAPRERAVSEMVKVKLSQPQINALVSLVFNIGVEAFRTSSVLRELNWGRYSEAADHILDWRFAKVKQKDGTYMKKPVLLGRREAEARLFRSGILEAHGWDWSEPPSNDALFAMAQSKQFDLRGLLDDRGLPVEDNDERTEDGRIVALPPDEEEPYVAA